MAWRMDFDFNYERCHTPVCMSSLRSSVPQLEHNTGIRRIKMHKQEVIAPTFLFEEPQLTSSFAALTHQQKSSSKFIAHVSVHKRVKKRVKGQIDRSNNIDPIGNRLKLVKN